MLTFDNQFTAQLPADPVTENIRHQVTGAIYSRVQPAKVCSPELVGYSREAAALLGLSEADCQSDAFLQVMSGNRLLPGMDPHATCYGGHQFGNWAGQLGDGRAINLGEVSRRQDGLEQHWMLQLKGSGPTPYSRTADGLAVLRSSIREFLCSEAMYHLGIPTTRALSLVTTGEGVMRDMLYDGNPQTEPGAVVCRMSSSFVRFGHFQILTARGEHELLKRFTDFVIKREFPHLVPDGKINRDVYITWFNEVCRRTAVLLVHWMRVGFVHGVMNTDNMSILGETIDYGPYGWLDDFDPDWTPNTTDAGQRRYRYSQQPAIGQWNLMQLANGILTLIGDSTPLEEALSEFAREYTTGWQQMMATKLGLVRFDQTLTDDLLDLLCSTETDMTLFYRLLADIDLTGACPELEFMEAYYQPETVTADIRTRTRRWLQKYHNTLRQQGVEPQTRTAAMNRINPHYVLRNYIAQLAIDDAESGDFTRIHDLLAVLRRPYEEQPAHAVYASKRPDWARSRPGCSLLSCSS